MTLLETALLTVCIKSVFFENQAKQRKNSFFFCQNLSCLLLSRLFGVVLNYLCQLFCAFLLT